MTTGSSHREFAMLQPVTCFFPNTGNPPIFWVQRMAAVRAADAALRFGGQGSVRAECDLELRNHSCVKPHHPANPDSVLQHCKILRGLVCS